MKICSRCLLSKSLEEFGKNSSSKDGLHRRCRKCENEYQKSMHPKYKVRQAAYAKKFREELNPEYYTKWRAEHTNEIKEYSSSWEKENPARRRAANSRRRSLLKGLTDLDKKKSVLFRIKIKDNPCFFCGEVKEFMEDDHYYPLVRGGTDHWWNIVRACRECNRSKGSQLASVWAGVQ